MLDESRFKNGKLAALHSSRHTPRADIAGRISEQRQEKIKQTKSLSSGATTVPHFYKSVDDLPKKYKGILLDQFGVLHNGREAYPDAIAAVEKLAGGGRKLVILSNSSRRSAATIPKLRKMGFQESCFAGAVTSGELTFRMLNNRPDAWWQSLGRRCLHITWGKRGPVPLEGLDLEVVGEPEDADFVLAHGTEALGRGDEHEPVPVSLDHVKGLLQRAAEKGIPLIVANPDVVTVSGSGLVPMPGTFAQWYASMGGEVRLMGKPDPIIYEAVMDLIGQERSQVLAVGDSLEHDICGAQAAGIDAMFVAGGIHADELGLSAKQLQPDRDVMSRLCQKHSTFPQCVISYLQ